MSNLRCTLADVVRKSLSLSLLPTGGCCSQVCTGVFQSVLPVSWVYKANQISDILIHTMSLMVGCIFITLSYAAISGYNLTFFSR